MIQLLALAYLVAMAVCFVIAAVGLTVALVAVARRRRSGRPVALPLVLGIVACLPFLAMAALVALVVAAPRTSAQGDPGPFLAAIERNDVESVRRQIREGADVNRVHRSYHHMTPLYFAVQQGKPEIVALLVEAKADVNQPADYESSPPLVAAIRNDDRPLVEYLLRHRADPNRRGSSCPALVVAAQRSHDPEIVSLLIDHGGDVNQRCFDEESALHVVLRRDNVGGVPDAFAERNRFATLLIDHGADLAAKDRRGKTALDYARELNRADLVDVINQRLSAPSSQPK